MASHNKTLPCAHTQKNPKHSRCRRRFSITHKLQEQRFLRTAKNTRATRARAQTRCLITAVRARPDTFECLASLAHTQRDTTLQSLRGGNRERGCRVLTPRHGKNIHTHTTTTTRGFHALLAWIILHSRAYIGLSPADHAHPSAAQPVNPDVDALRRVSCLVLLSATCRLVSLNRGADRKRSRSGGNYIL